MRLKNYLLELDELKYIKAGSDSIRLYSIGHIINEIYQELLKFTSLFELENKFRTDETFWNWISNKTGISIQELYKICKYWKSVCGKTDNEFIQLWNKIYENASYFGCMNGKPIKLPKYLDNNLAYLLGLIMGDGHLANPDKSYDKLTSYNSEIRITSGHEETFINLIKIFDYLFDYTPKIYSELSMVNRRFYRFVIKSKPMHRFFMNICGVPVGKKCYKIDVLPLIKNAPISLQKNFVAGFFDADGCVRLSKNRYPWVAISQLDCRILEYVVDLSKKLGIKWNGLYKCNHPSNRNYSIYISDKLNFGKFLANFKLRDPIRKKQIRFVLANMYKFKAT